MIQWQGNLKLTHSKITEHMVPKIQDPIPNPASHVNKVCDIALNVGLSSFQPGHWFPSLIHGPWVKETKWSEREREREGERGRERERLNRANRATLLLNLSELE